MLTRILEPEVMDTGDDAREYDAMDHAAVNAQFVTDLLRAINGGGWGRALASPQLVDALGARPSLDPSHLLRILDLGAGTAQIPIELCRRAPQVRVTAVDAAEAMLELARENIADAGCDDRIETVLADAKVLPFGAGKFSVVTSNSILHHIAEPQQVISEALRVAEPSGLQFHRDLCRPNEEAELNLLVMTYAGSATRFQQNLFADSLRAALTLDEMRELVAAFGFATDTVQMTSDRHWTWVSHEI